MGLKITNPVGRDDVYVVHNGIIVNHGEIWAKLGKQPKAEHRYRGHQRNRCVTPRRRR